MKNNAQKPCKGKRVGYDRRMTNNYHTFTLMLRWNNGFCKTINVTAISKESAIADAREAYDYDYILNA